MDSKQIRSTFIEFFNSKGHDAGVSAPMVVKNDPTLMFTNAGMNQFKDIFLGNSPAKSPRICNTQKCLRVSGKHNDLEEVGVDTYHHTMFEMLGTWSFGNYFKKEAIEWAWELLTEVYKIDKSRIYVTIFEGDLTDGTSLDVETYDLWKTLIDEDRIIKANKKDNFWEMGETGPCGPCSEIHVDLRSVAERKKLDGKALVNEDHPHVIEIWNLVFMEFSRMSNGKLFPLPNKHVDTGMGFERLCMVLQGKTSNYDTDVFMPLIQHLENVSGIEYGKIEKNDIALRVIADHIRAISFSIADGQLPSNTGAGYVIRRILRRAIRYGYQTLGLNHPFLYSLVSILSREMGGAFPELINQSDLIEKVIKEEEVSFFRTLEKGIERFNTHIKTGIKKVEGKFAFELYDTFGFPIDLTELMAKDNKLEVDLEEFNFCLAEQKQRSRNASAIETEDWQVLLADDKEEFIGYDYTEGTVRITRYRKVTIKDEERYQLVFNLTPFYAEGGGQVGDTGYIEANGKKVSIFNTKKENNLIIHFSKELPENPGAHFNAVVNTKNRRLTQANHSATHLVHEALREVLGTHVEQKGSLVNPKHLRFDFSHFSKMTDEEIIEVETLVNERVRANLPLEEHRDMPMDKALEMGAMALFGERYGDVVRLIKFGSSVELCGGTHVKSTGEIGTFKLMSESSVAAGIRRIECITSDGADNWVNGQLALLEEVKQSLKNPKDLIRAISDLTQQKSDLEKEVASFKKDKAGSLKGDLIKAVKEVNGINFIGQKVDLDAGSIKDLAFQLKSEVENLFMILGSEAGGKTTITVALSDALVAEKGLHAGNMVRELAKEIGGGGGGQPNFATAGGKNPAGIGAAIEKAKALIE
jgi:alanyl-tRNA synthetase